MNIVVAIIAIALIRHFFSYTNNNLSRKLLIQIINNSFLPKVFIIVLVFLTAFLFGGIRIPKVYASGTAYYVDNTCQYNGNGLSTTCAVGAGQAGPFNSVTNMQNKSGAYVGDDSISLKCGQTYRETFTVPSSGTSGHPITLNSYGTCTDTNKPILDASDLFSTWSAYGGGQGSTWQATATSQVYFVWQDGNFLTKGSGAVTLNDHEWFWASNVLYVRDDSGSGAPAGRIEGAVRTAANVFFYSKSYWNVSGIKAMHTTNANSVTSYGFRIYNGGNINFSQIETEEALGVTVLDAPNIIITRSKFNRARFAGTPLVIISGTTNATISYSVFRRSTSYALNITDLASVTLDNILIDQYGSITAIRNTSVGTQLLRNSIIPGTSSSTGSNIINSTAGTFIVSNSIVLPNPLSTTLWTGVTDGGGNIYSRPIGWKAFANTGLVSVGLDDTQYAPVWDEINHVADEYNISVHLAVFTGNSNWNAVNKSYIQDGINRGHGVASHTYTHSDLSVLTGLTLGCLKGTTSCTVTIANGVLTTYVDGVADLTRTLSSYSYPVSSLNGLCANLAAQPGYTCTGTNSSSLNTTAANLADVTNVDIKSAPGALTLDQTRYLDYEVDTNKTNLQTQLTQANGDPWVNDVFVYSYGGSATPAMVSKLQNAGFLGSRLTGGGSTFMANGVNPFKVASGSGTVGFGKLLYIFDTNNCNDSSGNSKNFTCSNVSYSSGVVPSELSSYQNYSANFNGTSSFAYRSDSDFNFQKGDGWMTAWIYPTALNRKQTIIFQGSDANNYQEFYISSNGTLVYSQVTGGAEAVKVETASGLLTAGAWQRVSLSFYKGLYRIYVDNILKATTASNVNPPGYTDKVYLGAGWDYALGQAQNFYGGYLHSLSVGSETYLHSLGTLNAMFTNGGIAPLYAHGDAVPAPMWRIFFEAAADNNTPLVSYRDSFMTFRTNGTLGSDGQTYTWIQPDTADYHLLASSAAINMGARLGYTLDYDGKPIVDNPDIGPYEYQTTYTVGGTVSGLSGTLVLQNNGGDNTTLTANGTFTFATSLNDNAEYLITVLTQPVLQTCTISNGSGNVAGANITNVTVSCSNNITPSPTSLPTSTPTPTSLPTFSPTPTLLPTFTPTPTSLPTSTPTPTSLPTFTPTPTSLPTSTPPDPICTDPKPASAPMLYGAKAVNRSSILLQFTPAGEPVSSYAVEYGTESGIYKYTMANIGGKKTTSITVKGLSSNTTYYFRVQGQNGCAAGDWSNELSAKTK